MTRPTADIAHYRPAAGAVIFNADGQVWLGRRANETKAEISNIVSEALNGTRVLVAPDSLTTRSTLSIDPAGSGHPIAGGRLMGKPDHFDLKMSGKTCYLVHRQSGEVYRVKTATCRAAES